MTGQEPIVSATDRSIERRLASLSIAALIALEILFAGAQPGVAASGGLIADVQVNEEYPDNVAPSVAFDGRYLYHTGYGGSVLHRIDVPPAGSSNNATGQVDLPITGAASGIMTLSYDAGRNAFWAIGGDGLSMYLLQKTGAAALLFTVDPDSDRPVGPVEVAGLAVTKARSLALLPGVDRHHEMAREALHQPVGVEILEAFLIEGRRKRT